MFAKLSVLALCLLHVSAWKLLATPEEAKAGDDVTITFQADGNDPASVDLYFSNADKTWKTKFESWVSVSEGKQFWYTIPKDTAAGGYEFIAIDSDWEEYCSNTFWVEKDW